MAQQQSEFFNIINSIFLDKDNFNSYSKLTLDRNAFMINRTMSIKFPLQANALNISKLSGFNILNSWNIFIPQQYRLPNFIYTKGSAKARAEKEKKISLPKKNDILDYCSTYNISYKTVMDTMKFFKEEMIEEIEDFIKLKKQQNE